MNNTEIREKASSENQIAQGNQNQNNQSDFWQVILTIVVATPLAVAFFDGVDKVLHHFESVKIKKGDTEIEINTVYSKKKAVDRLEAIECSRESDCISEE